MGNTIAFDLTWWLTVVELPALAGLLWLIWRTRIDAERAQLALREDLTAYKLEVARTYASIPYLKDVERRLTDHLLRIEAKLDSMPRAHGGRA